MPLEDLSTSSSHAHACTAALARCPQPLLSPCSPPVPRAGSCPVSPTPASQTPAPANHLLYQAPQPHEPFLCLSWPLAARRPSGGVPDPSLLAYCLLPAPRPRAASAFLEPARGILELVPLLPLVPAIRAYPPYHVLALLSWDASPPCLRPRDEGGWEQKGGALHAPRPVEDPLHDPPRADSGGLETCPMGEGHAVSLPAPTSARRPCGGRHNDPKEGPSGPAPNTRPAHRAT
jgi:hypothetical protein